MNKFKAGLCGVLALILCLVLAGCMNTRYNEPLVTPGITVVPQMTVAPLVTPPATTMMPGTTGSITGQPPATAFDWTASGATIEANIDKISEIDKSRIVVNGTTALVGVTFTSQYKGQMTERIRNMIAGEVMAADPSITTVAVTSAAEDVAKINEIADKIKNGSTPNQFSQEIDSIVRNVTTTS